MNYMKKFILIVLILYSFNFVSSPQNITTKIKANEYYLSSSDFDENSLMFINASLEFGVPASFLMAMAIEETSFGTKGVAVSNNNWFGTGNTIYPTPSSHKGRFEKYPDATTSVRDAARLLGKPNSYYKVTNIIISNGGLDQSYAAIAQSITNKWCVDEAGKPCTYDAKKLLDDIDKYNLKKYDEELKKLSVDDLKGILDKYYGPNAIAIPGFDKIETGWNGSYDIPEIDDNTYNSIYINTSYFGDYKKGYIYKKYSKKTLWDELIEDTEEDKVSRVISDIFLQGEMLYGDGKLHFNNFLFNGSDHLPPTGYVPIITTGAPLACYTRITSTFGDQESFRTSKHKGLDLAAPNHTAIYSITSGTVEKIYFGCPPIGSYGNDCGGGYGNYVKIKSSDGNSYIYAHMYTTPLVSVGSPVEAGQMIGVVGSSGSSTGPHLHFEVRNSSNTKINPLPYANVNNIPHC